jgi:hypothetical protein
MRRVYQILLIISVALLVLLVLYAAPPTRPWMEANLGPPLTAAFGGAWSTVKASAPYQFLLANPHLILVVGIAIGVCPLSFPIIHRSFNSVRGKFTRSSIQESGLYPKQSFPTQVSTQLPQPTATKTVVEPIPPVAPVPTPEPVKPESEATA